MEKLLNGVKYYPLKILTQLVKKHVKYVVSLQNTVIEKVPHALFIPIKLIH